MLVYTYLLHNIRSACYVREVMIDVDKLQTTELKNERNNIRMLITSHPTCSFTLNRKIKRGKLK